MAHELMIKDGNSTEVMNILEVKDQVELIQQVMKHVMKEGEHYGTVPGCGDKKTLLKPGAEKLASTFRFTPKYIKERIDLDGGHREYEITCELYTRDGVLLGEGVGSCSTMESKYRYRNAEQDVDVLDEPIPKDYRAKKARYAADGLIAKKIHGAWAWCKVKGCGEKIENPDPADCFNTVLKMAKKRAFIDALLTVTAASDIFVQDLEDEALPEREPIKTPEAKTPDGEEKKEAPAGDDEDEMNRMVVAITKLKGEVGKEKFLRATKAAGINIEEGEAWELAGRDELITLGSLLKAEAGSK